MKPNRIHTTAGGDRFLQTHITKSTRWSREAYRREERVSRFLTVSAAAAGILGFLAIVTVLSTR